MAQMSAPGSLVGTSWILPSSQSSTDPGGVSLLACLGSAVEGEVLSRSRLVVVLVSES